MSSQSFEIGDLVWAKMKGFPPWPARITDPPQQKTAKLKLKMRNYFVYFFGSKNYAWINEENIFHHSDTMVQEANSKKKPAQMANAIDEILEEHKKQPQKPPKKFEIAAQASCSGSDSNKSKLLKQKRKKSKDGHSILEKTPKPKRQKKKREIAAARKGSDSESQESEFKAPSITDQSEDEHQISQKNGGDARFASGSRGTEHTRRGRNSIKRRRADPYYLYLSGEGKLPQNTDYFKEARLPAAKDPGPYVELPPFEPSIDEPTPLQKKKYIKATDKKIGFIGLGDTGFGIVKNLLKSGHEVIFWNQTSDLCEPIIAAGGKRAETPAEVVISSDITMVCLPEPKTLKETVFGYEGIIKGFDRSKVEKGYVEMSLVDDETSKDIEDAIITRGGKYIEASFLKSKKLADEGMLIMAVKGDRSLYEDCNSCFLAISENATFVEEGDVATITNLAVNMFKGTVDCAVAELMGMSEAFDIPLKEIKDIVHRVNVIYPQSVANTIDAIHDKNFTTDVPLKHLCMCMKTGLKAAKKVNQPLYLASAAAEEYCKACEMRYGNHDNSAVFMNFHYE